MANISNEIRSNRLTAAALAAMKPGGRSRLFRCDTAAELESARRNAYYIKQNCPRPDGGEYAISCSLRSMVVAVSVRPKAEEGGAG